ncbi:MAG: flagellar M-ring protein FliF [Firmicutes bacterium]|nr:flagellar M-ring protein FliF [Bacillota bacterium]
MNKEKEANVPLKSPGMDFSSAGGFWSSLTPPARTGLIVVASISVVLIAVLVITNLLPPSMEVLFSQLNPEQAHAVVVKLEESNTPYRAGDDGATILVPRDQRDQLRLKLSPEINSQGAGFALFENNSNLITSDFERRVQWQIALESELSRTITSIEAVDNARVHLVLPEGSIFAREKSKPSASVFLKINPFVSLYDNQIQGILNLVAGSVENLAPENIIIIDSMGNLLFEPFQQPEGGFSFTAVEKQLALTRKFEQEVEGRLRTILERVYGPGRAVAMVSAELDFDTWERTMVTYDDPVNRSEQRIEERSDGMGMGPVEVGESNIPGYSAMGGSGNYSYDRIEEIINYEVGETRDFVAQAPGQIERLSVAVVLDDAVGSPEVASQVSTVMLSALGIDPARGDNFSVQLIPFDDSWRVDFDEEPAPVDSQPLFNLKPWALVAIIAVGVLLLVIIFISMGIAFSSRTKPQPALITTERALERVMEERIPEQVDQSKRQKVRQMGESEPENMALLLKTWLVED